MTERRKLPVLQSDATKLPWVRILLHLILQVLKFQTESTSQPSESRSYGNASLGPLPRGVEFSTLLTAELRKHASTPPPVCADIAYRARGFVGQCGEGCTSPEHGHGEKRKRGEGEDKAGDGNAAAQKKPNDQKIRVSATRHDSKVRVFQRSVWVNFWEVVYRVYPRSGTFLSRSLVDGTPLAEMWLV